jgi:hypothetical protein
MRDESIAYAPEFMDKKSESRRPNAVGQAIGKF